MSNTLNISNMTVDANGRVSFSGLGSGIDFRDTVDKIIAARSIPVDTLETRVTANTDKIDALMELQSRLGALQQSLSRLYGAVTFGNASNIFAGKSAFASASRIDGGNASPVSNLLGVSVTNAAATGSHEVEILRTAKSHKVSSAAYATVNTSLGFSANDKFAIGIDDPRTMFESSLAASGATQIGSSGTLNFTDANGNSLGSVSYAATDTLSDLTAAVNGSITGVTATLVTSGSNEVRLQLNSGENFKFTEAGGGTAMTDFNLGMRTITVTSQTTLQDLRDLINSANSGSSATGVTASIVSVGASENYLVLTKDQTGHAMTLKNLTGSPLQTIGILNGSGGFANQLQAAQTARLYADGLLDQTNTIYESALQAGAGVQIGTAGTLQFTRNGDLVDLGNIGYLATDTLADLRDKINASITGVTASIVTDGNGVRLELSGDDAFSIAETGGGSAIDDLGINNKRRVIERASNTISDLFTGVTLTLFQAERGTTIQLDIERDLTQVKKEIANFVDAYNELRILINSHRLLNEETGNKDKDSGVLFSSQALKEVTETLSQIIGAGAAGVDPNFSVFAQIGVNFIDLNENNPLLRQTLVIDESRLDEVLLNNPDSVRRMFTFDFSASDPRVSLLGFDSNTSYSPSGYTLNIQPSGDENLLTYSENLDHANWSKVRSTIAADAIAAPDGSMTADGLIADATNNTHYVTNAAPLNVTAGETYLFSTYVKAGDKDDIRLTIGGAGFGSPARAEFNLTAGTVTGMQLGAEDATIEDAGNGWYRVSVRATATASSSAYVELYAKDGSAISYTGDGSTVDAYFWGSQFSVADSSGTVMTDANLTATRGTIGANVATAPNGTMTADGLSADTENNSHYVSNTAPIQVVAGTEYTYTAFVKEGDQPKVRLNLNGGNFPAASRADFDLSTGTVTSTGTGVSSATIESAGNGWYKVSITATATTTGTVNTELYSLPPAGVGFAGDGDPGTYDLLFWNPSIFESASAPPGTYVATTDQPSSGGTANINGDPNGADDGTVRISGNTISVQDGDATGLRVFFSSMTKPESIQIDFTVGIGAQMYFAIQKLMDSKTGAVKNEIDTLTGQNTLNEQRIAEMKDRLEVQRQSLLERYIAMETAMATARRIMDSISQTMDALFARK
jgi:flagellar capping protein FliD